MQSDICKVDGCRDAVKYKTGPFGGYCNKHYLRLKRHGDPLGGGPPRNFAAYDWLVSMKDHSSDECLIWPFYKFDRGYPVVSVPAVGQVYAHRKMCEISHGPPPAPDHEAAHSCGRGMDGCVNQRHLRWDTPTGNSLDRLEHGTHMYGAGHSMAKLTEEQAREIYRRAWAGELQKCLAAEFGVSVANVSMIKHGHSWGLVILHQAKTSKYEKGNLTIANGYSVRSKKGDAQ